MPVFSETAIQISGTSTPSKSNVTIDCFTGPNVSSTYAPCLEAHSGPLRSFPRSTERQPSKHFPIVLPFDRHAANTLLMERPITKPTGICHNQHMPFPWRGRSHQNSFLVPLALFRLLFQIISHQHAWFARIFRVQQK